ncbi:unnamed protein product [Rhizopus stolonifer]
MRPDTNSFDKFPLLFFIYSILLVMDSSEIALIIILTLILIFLLIGFVLLLRNIKKSNQGIIDVEQRIAGIKEHQLPTKIQMYEKAIVKDDMHFQTIPLDPSPIMTPKKDTNRRSVLHKIYSIRKNPNSSPRRPSSIRPPSFLPMQEKIPIHPPTYEESVI